MSSYKEQMLLRARHKARMGDLYLTKAQNNSNKIALLECAIKCYERSEEYKKAAEANEE